MKNEELQSAPSGYSFPGHMNAVEQEEWLVTVDPKTLEKAAKYALREGRSSDFARISKERERRVARDTLDAALKSVPAPWYLSVMFWLTLICALAAVAAAIFAYPSWKQNVWPSVIPSNQGAPTSP